MKYNYKKLSPFRIRVYDWFSSIGSVIKSTKNSCYYAISWFKRTKFRSKKWAVAYLIAEEYSKRK